MRWKDEASRNMIDSTQAGRVVNPTSHFLCSWVKICPFLSQKIYSSNISEKELIVITFREREYITFNEALISCKGKYQV